MKTHGLIRHAALWGFGGAAALAAHIAVGTWVMQIPSGDDLPGPEDAIPVDLVMEVAAPTDSTDTAGPEPQAEPELEPAPDPAPKPEPEPAPTSEQQAAPQQEPEQKPTPPAIPETLPEPANNIESEPEIEPEPEIEAEPEIEPETEIEVAPISDLALAASLRPHSRPERRKPAPVQRAAPTQQPAPAPPATASPPAPAQPAPAQAPRSGGAARSAPAAPAATPGQISRWQAQAQTRIARHMQRTSLPGGRRGVQHVNLQIQVAANGDTSARLAGSTGDPQADAAIQRQASRMPALPPPPSGQPVSLLLPVAVQFR